MTPLLQMSMLDVRAIMSDPEADPAGPGGWSVRLEMATVSCLFSDWLLTTVDSCPGAVIGC